MFKMIRAINLTDSRSIWTRMSKDIDQMCHGGEMCTVLKKHMLTKVEEYVKIGSFERFSD